MWQQLPPSSGRSRWIRQIAKAVNDSYLLTRPGLCNDPTSHKQLGITMNNSPTCQSQLPRLNLGVLRINRFKPAEDPHLSTSTPLPLSVRIHLILQREKGHFPNPYSTYHTTLIVFLCWSTTIIYRQFLFA